MAGIVLLAFQLNGYFTDESHHHQHEKQIEVETNKHEHSHGDGHSHSHYSNFFKIKITLNSIYYA